MINQPDPVSIAQTPRAAAYCNGELLQGVIQYEVDNNNYFQADTFRLDLALSGQPANRGLNFWASLEQAEIEILFGFPRDSMAFSKGDLTSFINGYVDDIEIDPVADRITLAGRDLTSLLIDTRNTLTYVQNRQKSSDIVTTIANQVGLTPVVTATVAPVGQYAQIDHALLEQKTTYWDLICKLAQIEGFQAYVKGRALHFEPRMLPTAEPYVIRYNPISSSGAFTLNAMRIALTRNLSVAKDIHVDVVSWDQKRNRLVRGHADRPRNFNKVTRGVAKLDAPPGRYFYSIPGLDSKGADAKAAQIQKYLSLHEMNLSADLPGDVLLTPQSMVRLEGTGSPFDQVFFADSIRRSFSFDDGFRMQLSAKNQSPNNPPPN